MIKDSVLKSFTGKNVLVTGGTGMIGRQVVDILSDVDCFIKTVSLEKEKVNDKTEHICGDLSDFNLCKSVTKDMDYVFHIAGAKGSIVYAKEKIASHFITILSLGLNFFEACRINKVNKVVFSSSIGAYSPREILKEHENSGEFEGPPMDFAGWAKRMSELQIYAYKVEYKLDNFSIVRLSNTYGPGDLFDTVRAMVVPSLIKRIYDKEDPLVVWGDGSTIRDFAYSRDIAEGIILALYHGTKGNYVNLGSGVGCSIKELIETLNSFIDFNYVFDATKPSGYPKRVMDISLAQKMIDYNPTTSLSEGLKNTYEWYVNSRSN